MKGYYLKLTAKMHRKAYNGVHNFLGLISQFSQAVELKEITLLST